MGISVMDFEDLRQASEDFDLLRGRLLRAARAMAIAENARADLLLRLTAPGVDKLDLHLPAARRARVNAEMLLSLVDQLEELSQTDNGGSGSTPRQIVLTEGVDSRAL